MHPDPEIAQLKEEVATLRRQMRELRQLITVEYDETPERRPLFVNLRCGVIILCNPSAPDDIQGMLCASDEGASLSLRSGKDSGYLYLTAENGSPCVQLFANGNQEAIQLTVLEKTSRGQIAVFDQGKPRAVMKSTEHGGVLSVVHDDGKTRACIIGDVNGGEAHVIGAQGHSAVKLAGNPEQGGFIAVNNLAGQPRAAISATPEGAAIHLFQAEAKIGIAMIAQPDNAALFLQTGDEKQNRVSLMTCASGADVRVHDAKGTVVAELTNEPEGGGLRLCDRAGKERISLRQADTGPFMRFNAGNGDHLMLLSGIGDAASLNLQSTAGHRILLTAPASGATIMMFQPKDELQIALGCSEKSPAIQLLPKAGESPVASLHVTEHGGVCLLSDREGIHRAGLAANLTGGQVSIFNDLGIIRAELACADDGGLLKLNWGGNIGVSAIATHQGGGVLVNDANGELRASLPANNEEED